jgi:hypothetical protein
VNQLSWSWIALDLTVPPLVALLLAWPFWRKAQMIFGNIVGTGVIFGTAIALILREHVELDRAVQDCLDAGDTCWPEPSAFTRFGIYASIALFEVIALFALSLRVERKRDHRDYAPEWRR